MLTENLAIELINSKEEFPVDFDLAWQMLGFSNKANAKRMLVSEFEKSIDFSSQVMKTSLGGRPTEKIFLTLDCFKSLGMMAGTKQGKEVRRYFLNCEKAAKEASKNNSNQQHQMLWWERYKLFHTRTEIPDGHWCVFGQLIQLVWSLEAGGFVFPEGRCVDISVGKCWNSYLRSEGYNANNFQYYPHHYPDHRGVQDAKIYPDELLPLFRKWLKATYVVGSFPNYVKSICTTEEQLLIASIVRQRQLMAAS